MDKDEYGENILHYMVTKHIYNEKECFLAVKTLLYRGVDPNYLDNCNYNFIQTAIDTGYSEEFICLCIKEALKYGLDINNQDEDGDTIVHGAIKADDYHDGIGMILKILMENSYNPHIKNNKGKTIDELVFKSKKYSNQEKREIIRYIDKAMSSVKPSNSSNSRKR